ncbi:alpha/beta hydrolase [Ottowia thiooxydans]|uniref:alpha/beta hydrolase n=1 Tax=Ottowia thiooxydans TaxID=219182 RepID=UPI0004901D6D|nr:alpha/beta hydrolase [Ottowia thiooxydans]
MRQLVERMDRAPYPPMHTLSAEEGKAAYAKSIGVLDVPKPNLPRIEDFFIPARDGYRLPARLYAPRTGTALPALLYMHGGGFTIGSIESHDTLCRTLAHGSGAAVVSLDYRLAPEYRFPTAAHDSWDAMQWLAREGTALGLDTQRLAVGGDSAGGTLAAVTALHARDAGLPLCLQLLIYPGTTAHQDTDSHALFAQGPVLDKPLIDWFFSHYIDVADRADWRFAPLFADDAEGLAPAWIGLAECDPLVDEGLLYADKLRAAGVAVDLEIYRGVVHGFINMGRAIVEARQLHSDASAAMRQAFSI